MKQAKRILAVLMAVLMLFGAFPANAFAAATETDRIVLPKSEYEFGEKIIPEIYNTNPGTDWLGLYLKDDDVNKTTSFIWDNVSDVKENMNFAVETGHVSNRAVRSDFDNYYTNGNLLPGEYKLVYLLNGGYNVASVAYFTVKEIKQPETQIFKTDKTEYCVGESINVTATAVVGNWIGLYGADDKIVNEGEDGYVTSYFWYYPQGSYNGISWQSGETYDILQTVNNNRADGKVLPAGKYTLYFFPDGGYGYTNKIDFTVKEHDYSKETVKKASFENDGEVVVSCACGSSKTKETISKATATLEYSSVSFDSSEKKPTVTVKDASGKELVLDTDFEVTYENNVNVGLATVNVTFKNDCARYTGTTKLQFNIVEETHTHEYKTTVTKATFGKDGKIEQKCSCEATEGEAVIIPAAVASLENPYVLYDGEEKTPEVVVKDTNGNVFTKGTDYTVSFESKKDIGVYDVKVTLNKENYEGETTLKFTISHLVTDKTVYEVGEPIIPSTVGATDAFAWVGLYLKNDYPEDESKGGVVSLNWSYVTGLGENANFAVESTKLYSGRENRKEDFATYYSNGFLPGEYKLIYFIDGEYTVGSTVYITIKNYESPEEKSLTLNKTEFCVGENIMSTAVANSGDLVGIFNKGANALEDTSLFWYYVGASYAVDGSYGKGWVNGKEYNLLDTVNNTSSTELAAGEYIVCLVSNKVEKQVEITVKDHSYVNNQVTTKASFENDGKIEGECVCLKHGVSEVISKAQATLEYVSVTGDGTEKKPAVSVKDANGTEFVLDTDYVVTYENNINVGTAKAIVTFKEDNARYAGSTELEFNIVASDHTHDFKETVTKATFDKDGKIEKKCSCEATEGDAVIIPAVSSVTLEKNVYLYDGEEKTPAVSVKTSKGDKLVEGTDFTVAYENNKEFGTATAKVTLIKENYEGTKDVNFKVSKVITDKEVYNEGEPIKVKSLGQGSDWVGIYAASDPLVEEGAVGYVTSFFWANCTDFTGEFLDLTKASDKVFSNINVRPGFTSYWNSSTLFAAGDYKIVLLADGGYNVIDTVTVTVKAKEVAKNVTVSTDKSEYSEDDVIEFTSTNTTTKDTVAIYEADANVKTEAAYQKAFFSEDSTAKISAKYLKDGNYKAVVLFEDSTNYVVAQTNFTVKRNEELAISVSTSKDTYCVGEDIVVSSVGYGKDWVGIYSENDEPGEEKQPSYYWYYPNFSGATHTTKVNVFYGIGDDVVINNFANDGYRQGEGYVLPAGKCIIYLFDDDGYDILAKKEITIKEHDYEVINKTDSTCTTEGSQTLKCKICKKSDTKTIPVVEHSWKVVSVINEATCTKNQVAKFECEDCAAPKTAEVEGTAKKHKYELVETVEATCSQDGYAKYVCKRDGCDDPNKVEILTAEHKYVTKTLIEATCEETGVSQDVCKFCGAVKEQSSKILPATGHKLVLNAALSYKADCTRDGLNHYDCVNEDCDYFEEKVNGTKTSHDYKQVITKATPKNNGKIESKCSICSSVQSSSVIAAVSKVSLVNTSYVCDNKAKTPIVTVCDSNGKTLSSENYTVTYKNNKAAGTATAVVTLKGDKYEGSVSLNFTIKLSATKTTAKASASNITVNWTAVTGASGYYVYRKTGNGKWIKIADVKTLKYVDKDVKAGVKYQYKAVAYNGKNTTDGSVTESVSLLATITVSAQNAASGISVKWSKVNGASKYIVYRRKYTGKKWSSWTKLTTTSKNTYTDKKAASGTKYQYKVKVSDGANKGKSASTSTILCLARATVTVTNAKSAVTVKWSKVNGAKTYTVYRSVYSGGKWSKWTKLSSVKKTSYTDKNAKAGSKYKYKVVAVNGSNTGADSKAVSIIFLKVTSLKAESASNGISLKWSKVAGAKGYYVYRSEYKNGKWTKAEKISTIKSAKTVKYTDKSAKAGVSYKYSVQAYNSSYASALVTTNSIKK